MKERLAEAGRDPSGLQVTGTLPLVKTDDGSFDLERTMEQVPAFAAALVGVDQRRWRRRLVAGAALAVAAIAFANLMHFSQGWVQFGYRFSNDFVPWALLLVAIGGSFYAQFVSYIDPESVMGFQFSLLMALPAVALAEESLPCLTHQRGLLGGRWCCVAPRFQQLVLSRSHQIKSPVESTHI